MVVGMLTVYTVEVEAVDEGADAGCEGLAFGRVGGDAGEGFAAAAAADGEEEF